MREDDEQGATFTEEQQRMFQNADGTPMDTRPRTPGVQTDPVIPGTGASGSEKEDHEESANKN